MKTCFFMALAIVAPLCGLAQPGTFNFSNPQTFPIKIATGTDAVSLASATLIGTNSISESLGAGPGQVNVELYIAPNGTVPQFASGPVAPPVNFFLAGTATNSGSHGSLFQGTFQGGNPHTIPSTVDGGIFTTGTEIEYDFFAFTMNGNFAGLSALGTDYTLEGGFITPAEAFGTGSGQIGGWTLTPIPEPSLIIFSALGAATCLLLRRKPVRKPVSP